MEEFLKRLRGVLGTAVTWGTVWGAIFAALVMVIWLVDPGSIDPGEKPYWIAAMGAFYGLVTGTVFGVLLSLTEGGKSIRDLSLGRVALWGALAAAVYPLLTPVDNSMLMMLCPIGAVLAVGSVAAAKRAELSAAPEQPVLPPG